MNHEDRSSGRCSSLRFTQAVLAGFALLAAATGAVQAGTVYVPNGSFESPETVYADPANDFWQESPTPFWWDENSYGPWTYLAGVFLNTTNGDPAHIDNMEGSQGGFLFAQPGVALFQDYNSIYGTNTAPKHDFDARFQVGRSYHLAVGVIGGGGGMSNGATMTISLYYRDGSSNMVTLAATVITNTPARFPTQTHFVDFAADLPAVRATDAWASRNVGIQLLSTVGFDKAIGYWDMDNVRLTETIEIPNGSFELPETAFADPANDFWQESPTPFWWDENSYGPWTYLAGVFLNTTNGDPSHIDNMERNQGGFMFAQPGVALFQDYNSIYGTNATPLHDFDVKFEVGKSYHLTVGVIGGGGGMSNGATMAISLYYRDGASNMVTVAATSITNTPAQFPTRTHFVDFTADLPAVRATDAWAGRNIGVQLLSTVGFDTAVGYWDVDNVRLAAIREPVLIGATQANGQFGFRLQSEPGNRFEIRATTNLGLDFSNWTALGMLTNASGNTPFSDPASNLNRRFYRAHQLP